MGQKEIIDTPTTGTLATNTICALATAPGGALGIIRVSGPAAFAVVSSLCHIRCDSVAANTVHYTHIAVPDGGIVDEVMVSVFRAPHSYTGEDSVEISCHGSRYILNKVLELLVQNGCRMAEPGEFTRRAYMNGKMDLAQAEAVADLIASTNRATHQLAMSQLRGHVSSAMATLRDQLLRLTSLLELELDFSDHEDLEFANRSELLQLSQLIDTHVQRLADSFQTGNALKQGIPVAIVGAPNVGKSTLLNTLLGEERAIVSDIQGTTRDAIEETTVIDGVTFRFIDTAGIRHTADEVELMGIQRTYQAIEKARIVLWLFDTLPAEAEVSTMTERCQGRTLIPVFTKCDLCHAHCDNIASLSVVTISAKLGEGLASLRTAICDAAGLPTLSETDVIVTNARHYDALQRAHTSLLRVIDGIETTSADLLAEELRHALDALAEITGGQITPQETLNNIFSHFCVGK